MSTRSKASSYPPRYTPITRYAMATPIWAGEQPITERELRLTRGSRFTTMRLGRHYRVVPFSSQQDHKINKNTWAVVSGDNAFWYFGTFKQCQHMLDRIEMHQARWAMVEGTMAEGYV